MAIDIGRIAYEAYVKNISVHPGFRPRGVTLDKWEDLGSLVCNAWRASAMAVLGHISTEVIKHDVDLL